MLSKDGDWPLYIALYKGQGSILSWITFTNTATDDLSGALNWIKPGGGKYYSAAFAIQTAAWGSRYDQLPDFSGAEVVLSGGGLAQSITNRVGSSDLKLTFSRSSGAFKGTVLNPAGPKRLSFNGVVLQKRNIGLGCFLNGSGCGEVYVAQ